MRKMLLSFKADVYKKLMLEEKIYEHRKIFPDEPIEAYLYVSAPIKSIVGIIHLNNRIELIEWKNKFHYDNETVARIENYMKDYKYVMEISDFQHTNMISLETLRKDVVGFVVPQMYYYIDDTPLLEYLKENLIKIGPLKTNHFDNIKSKDVCKS